MEEGIELWLAVVKNASVVSPELLNLVPRAIPLLDDQTHTLKRILAIIEGYVLLATLPTLSLYAQTITEKISLMLGDLKPAASNSLLSFLDIILQCCNLAQSFKAIGQMIYNGPLIRKLLEVIVQGTEMTQVIVGYLVLLSRMVYYDPDLFIQAINAIHPTLLDSFIVVLLDKFDNIGQRKQRKMCVLALASLIGTGNTIVMGHIEGISATITSVIIDIAGMPSSESLLFTFESRDIDDDADCPETSRRELLHSHDVLFVDRSVVSVTQAKLQECEQRTGGQNMKLFFDKVDKEILQQLQHVLTTAKP